MVALATAVTGLSGPAVAAGGGAPVVSEQAPPATTDVAPADEGGAARLEETPLTPDAVITDQVDEVLADDPAGDTTLTEEEQTSPEALPFVVPHDEEEATATTPEPSGTVLTAQGSASGITVVGVTWEHGTATDALAVEVRTRTGDRWSEWQHVSPEPTERTSDDDGVVGRDGTEPFLAGVVDVVEVAVRDDGAGPRDVRLAVVDEANDGAVVEEDGGTDGAAGTPDHDGFADLSAADVETVAWTPSAVQGAAALDQAAVGTIASSPAKRPTIYSRVAWGANESIATWTPATGRITAATVHHTVGTNSYTAGQVPSLIRGIYTYHAQSRGWGDIGYNFLVDKYGRVWEGRKGGVDRAIVAAHASGYNSVAFGVSVMGNYDVAVVPGAVVSAVAQVIAWKFDLHGVTTAARTSVGGVTRPTVFGHRDVGQTACPGRYLYDRLPEIRSRVAALRGEASGRIYRRDLGGDSFADLLVRGSSRVVLQTTTGSGFATPATIGSGWPAARTISPGDWDGDGRADMMLVDGAGKLWLYPRSASGWKPRSLIGSGWDGLEVVGGHDWDGDGRPDLLGRARSSGALYLYPSNGSGGFKARRTIGSGWDGFSRIAVIGDLANGNPAVVAQTPGGSLYTYRSDGAGNFLRGRTHVGTGWHVMTALVGAGDVNDDGRADLVARDRSGNLWLYPGDGNGTFRGRSLVGSGWNGFGSVHALYRQGNGQTFVAVTTAGSMRSYDFRGVARFDRPVTTSVPVTGSVVEVVSPGDWDGDGRADVILRHADGRLMLHRGTGGGAFASTGRLVGSGWQGFDQVVPGGNWVGDGRPSLIALNRSTGQIWLYPGDGKGGFHAKALLASGVSGVDRIATGGLWSSGRAPDLLTREASTGRLQLRRGNGAALLSAPTTVGNGWQSLAGFVGTGDVDGDGRPDVVGIMPDGRLFLYAGSGTGGFLEVRPYGTLAAGSVVS
ncbi:FG-GAP-like repeat-containing protein [Cellulosimicrobium cellulans]|uniref:FG-GAP-like repeat-containing protein n=1 Tax=Cellulosimicrobium cellulans TaxID=1710 RepID=UPI0036F0B45C